MNIRDSHSVTLSRLGLSARSIYCEVSVAQQLSNYALVHKIAADTQLWFKNLYRIFTHVKKCIRNSIGTILNGILTHLKF